MKWTRVPNDQTDENPLKHTLEEMAKDAFISTNPASICQLTKHRFRLLLGNYVAKITSFCNQNIFLAACVTER